MKTHIPFQKDGWLKFQNLKNCCAHDILRSAPNMIASLNQSTVMSILLNENNNGLVIFTDFSALLIELAPDNRYLLKPDAIRLKRRIGKLSLHTQNKNLHSSRKILRVQNGDGPTLTVEETSLTHPFKAALLEEITHLHATATFAPLHTDWETWTLDTIRWWQQPNNQGKRLFDIEYEASFMLDLLDINHRLTLLYPHYKDGTFTPFMKKLYPKDQSDKVDILIDCLNDPLFGSLESATTHHKGIPRAFTAKPEDTKPNASAHRLMHLANLIQKHSKVLT